ncbi:G-protein coupled receptor moody isoform X3 [Drosophila sulfurigaster albostrigata]|nr:G-protein coupled receptor moody isoform X3 [Drosophila sulfurigaster albostrigata]XP_062138195.1 G-protein coupled receptor moody isoform X3 [Drosophila sulfurigaster albostrigata]XP_062138196.1 G-protein coupled receptor moody isoform X3 [Drosophila sulfurigaster albostrigata]
MSDDTTVGLGYGGDMDPKPGPTIALDAADESGFSQSLLTFAAIMTFLIMIVGICGNFLTVVALLKCPKVRNVAAAFIISLCIADLLFCALVLPFQGLRFVQGTWRHGAVLCRLIPFIQYGNIGVSLLCIAMITINRYVMITHHGCYARIYKRHWIAVMIAACWLISYGMQLPTLLGAWGRFGYDDRLQTCSIMSDDHGHSSKTTLFITAFVIPCLVIIACYAKIFWVVHKSEQRLKRHANKQNSIPNNLRPVATATSLPTGGNAGDSQTQSQTAAGAGGLPASRVSSDSSSSYSTDVPEAAIATGGGKQPAIRVKDQREVRAKRNEWRITKMVLAIFLSFVICYLPITIVKVADKDVDHPSWHIFSYIMLYLSACINPIIYVIMNKQYRKAYKTVVLCQPARLLLPFGKTNGGASSAAEKWKDTGLSNNHSRTIVSQMSGGATATATATVSGSASGVAATNTAQTSDCQPSASQKSTQSLELMSRGPDLISKSNLPTLVMPTSTSTPTPTPTITCPPPPPSVTLGNAAAGSSRMLPLKKNNHSYINNGFNSSGNSNNSSVSQSSAIYRPGAGSMGSGSAPLRRITMVGDDIILEEEELPATPSPTATSPPESPAPPPPQTAPHPLAPNNVAAAAAAMAASKVTKSPIYMNVNSPKRMQSYSDAHIPAKDAVQQDTASASKVQQAAMFPNTKD